MSPRAALDDDWGGVTAIPSEVLILADPQAAHHAAEAVQLAGRRVGRTIDWTYATAELDGAVADLILAEAAGQDEGSLALTLPLLAALVERGARLVIACELDQLDQVAAWLFGSDAQLLCNPSAGERIAALLLTAATPARRVRDPAREEGEAARLLRLGEELARIADTLTGMAQTEGDAGVGERKRGYRGPPAERGAPAVTAEEVRAAIRSRRLRDQAFGPGWFEDPAWDMLLDLFAAEFEGTPVSVSSLCIAAAVAPTTALRWIAKMGEADLLERRADPGDRRRAFMALTEHARAALTRYGAAVKRAGLTFA